MLIGVTGYATAGKDAVADVILRHTDASKVSWADPLRRDIWTLNPIAAIRKQFDYVDGVPLDPVPTTYQQAIEWHGYTEAKAKYPELRRLLQVYGTDVHREIDPDYWVNRTLSTLEPGKTYVVPDVRFPNEAAVCDHLILVIRPGVSSVNGHASDAGLAFPFSTAEIINDGTLEDLEDKVMNLVQRWVS